MMKAFAIQCKNALVAHKKKVVGIVVLVVLLGAFAAGTRAMFRVSGVVTEVGNNSITVTNFFRTQTVDLTGAPVNATQIKIGDRVKIQKNIQGNILYVRTYSANNEEHRQRKLH
jgi:hypothetical protein